MLLPRYTSSSCFGSSLTHSLSQVIVHAMSREANAASDPKGPQEDDQKEKDHFQKVVDAFRYYRYVMPLLNSQSHHIRTELHGHTHRVHSSSSSNCNNSTISIIFWVMLVNLIEKIILAIVCMVPSDSC